MKTDRELLEYAAKAAGYVLPRADDHDEIGRQYEYHLGLWVKHPWGFGWFRPHIDDGQALRLAVQLGMMAKDSLAFDLMQDFMDWRALNMTSATRRAITCAAAQMQLNKEQANG